MSHSPLDDFNHLCGEFAKKYQSPLLIMFYDDDLGQMLEDDTETIYKLLRQNNLSIENPIEQLTIILHTSGGSPDAAYQIAQTIRKFASSVLMIIPYMAASAGTILAFCGDKLYMGPTGFLTAIDVRLGNLELASIQKYLKFAIDVREELEKKFESNGLQKAKTNVESDLLVELVKQVGAINVGSFYRKNSISAVYATKLLRDYLLSQENDRIEKARTISHTLTNEIPAHDFRLDRSLCVEAGIPVEELGEEPSDRCRNIIDILKQFSDSSEICPLNELETDEKIKEPFFSYYPYSPPVKKIDEKPETPIDKTNSK